MKNQTIMIMTACAGMEEAQSITSALLEKRLAATVQSSTITSSYRWQGEIQNAVEIRLVIKSQAQWFKSIEQCIKELHSYECPEIIAIDISQTSTDCLAWITQETQ